MPTSTCLSCRVPFKRLSSPFEVLALDLQQRVDAVAGAAASGSLAMMPKAQWETEAQLQIKITSGGLWNGVACWFEVLLFTPECWFSKCWLGKSGLCLICYVRIPLHMHMTAVCDCDRMCIVYMT